jgi:hypothetical protein
VRNLLKQLYHRLPLLRELRAIEQALGAIQQAISVNNFVQINRFFDDELKHNPKYTDRRKLNHYEWQVFSQNGEDGILAEIFRRIGTRSRFFVESGVGDGLENNTAWLLAQGWRGCWMDGDASAALNIRSHFNRPLGSGDLKLLESYVTAENFEDLLTQLGVPAEFDFLSLDIDRNTYHVLKALRNFRPRVIAVEYNATFRPDIEWVADYHPTRLWNSSAYFGASLKAYEQLAKSLGYVLIGCDFSGTNAFLIRNDEPLEWFADPFTAENHYEPPRYWSLRREAHPRCFDDTSGGATSG